jgi:hypothetical protein
MLLVNRKNDKAFEAHLDFLILDPPEENLLIYARSPSRKFPISLLPALSSSNAIKIMMHYSIFPAITPTFYYRITKKSNLSLAHIHQLCRNIESKLKNYPRAFILV